jgi:hypothetical protein
VVGKGAADLLDIEADEVSDLDVGDPALGLHLADPAQGGATGLVEEGFKKALSVDEANRIGLWVLGEERSVMRHQGESGLEFNKVIAVDEDPKSGAVLFGEADDGGFGFTLGELVGLVPEPDRGEALSLLALDEEVGMEGVGPGEL